MARHPAEDTRHRIGTLFFNPGGPGDGGARYVVAADTFFSETLRARFDIVSMDPRGVGDSTPIRCGLPLLTPATNFFPRTQREFDQFRDHNRAVARSCRRLTGAQFQHSDTISVARDHEALRLALHQAKVSWLGLSYGTQLAANYAQLYPGRTRAMVLDAALEHSASEVLLTSEGISTVEQAFDRFATWCATAATCALRGQNVAALYDALVRGADHTPIPVPGALRPVTGADIRMNTPTWLVAKAPNTIAGPFHWAAFSEVLKRAIAGDASGFAFPPAQGATDALFGRLANACGDYVNDIHTYQDMQRRIVMARQLAPHLQGGSEAWLITLCIGWPYPATNPPHPLRVVGVPTLIVHATHDPSVSYRWAFGLAAQIQGSSVLTRQGDGHTSYYSSPCARATMDDFLISLRTRPAPICPN